MPSEDLRPLFSTADAGRVQPALDLRPVTSDPHLVLDADTTALLRDGLGGYDMEIRWMAHLDGEGVLRMWRSWTGLQVYEAGVTGDRISGLRVEQHPDRYTGSLDQEPELFCRVLISVVNELRRFRAGYTPYGPASPSTGPEPSRWP
ncbi:hypothetical protein FB565_008225 [Actinoplanes lutulentus]|uniref:Uncharacterized protein n=1 Tax=Actinoplanes lutulentus TaxID=1287878 RepID=A0A327Z7W6_9ACTN|nr:hypothetical protein [Actinoplanes lutulentus]MBB2948442.1 hypothetical protein [Actinoplanes lutulentus]RAK34525.1 hypothetical protein B0I29_111124 [Actinoplanes lutulentus]